MKKINVYDLESVLCADDLLLMDACEDELRKINNNYLVFRNGEYYVYARGEIPIMFVVHVDTMRNGNNVRLARHNDVIYNKNGILGADDRAGVFALFSVLRRLSGGNEFPSVLLTNFEESGFLGVECFLTDDVWSRFDHLFVGLDRHGKNDFVYYSKIDKSVIDYVSSFGYKESQGILSDVFFLTCFYDVPHVNLSVGYYNEHRDSEYLVVSELNESINKIYSMVLNPYKPNIGNKKEDGHDDMSELRY